MKETNKNFAGSDMIFKEACLLAGENSTARQASKYRRGKGKAYTFKNQAKKVIEQKNKKMKGE